MKRVYFALTVFVVSVITIACSIYTFSIQAKTRKWRGPELAVVAGRPLADIIKESEVVIIGKVVDISDARFASEGNGYHEDALIFRSVTIDVEEKLFDSLGIGNRLTIPVIGGSVELPPDIAAKKKEPVGTMRACGEEARFEPWERVLLFLKKGTMGYKKASGEDMVVDRLQLVNAWQGKYRLEGEQAINDLPERSMSRQAIEQLISEIKSFQVN